MVLRIVFLFLIFSSRVGYAQDIDSNGKKDHRFIGLGFSMGKTLPSISIFPETENQKGIDLTFGKTTYQNKTWAKFLNYPKTGIAVTYADFGNLKQVGYSVAVLPFLDFGVFQSFTNRVRFQVGLGASYHSVIYDKVTNPGNFGVSTPITWAFRSFVYYDVAQTNQVAVKLGVGATHFSNGHTRLPNHGLNSVLATLKTEFKYSKKEHIDSNKIIDISQSMTQNYVSTRFGLGQKVLARGYNSVKNVYTASFAIGKIKNKTYKYGLGMYYRFYDDYYDFIKSNDELSKNQFAYLKENPFHNATTLGAYANFEILMNHFSVETELGVNFYKPAYKLDWYLNNGSSSSGQYIAQDFASKAKIKQVISSRLGFRYYAFSSQKSPQHNVFLAANINANLGQADFSELSLGYVYSPRIKG